MPDGNFEAENRHVRVLHHRHSAGGDGEYVYPGRSAGGAA